MPNLVGIGNSQVPTNAMLGGLAYQDSVGEIVIDKIKAKTGDTAVDIFVYDTRKDSDGGAWRKRATTQSWYNEGASSKRGARKEFPAVAVIVCLSNHIKIYDGDDPNLSLWMDVRATTKARNKGWMYGSGLNAVTALNGIIAIGANWNIGDEGGLLIMDFVKDELRRYESSAGRAGGQLSISQRGTSVNLNTAQDIPLIVDPYVSDVAMTVLPNAPIDASTGLPIPTIAIATNGGVSVIKDDATVVDHTDSASSTSTQVAFTQDGKIAHSHEGHTGIRIDRLKFSDFSYGSNKVAKHNSEEFYINYGLIASGWSGNAVKLNEGSFNSRGQIVPVQDNILAENSDKGLNLLARDFPSSPDNNRVAYITSNYNTGWMHGNIKGAFLSSTDDTNVTGSELLANPGPSFSNTTNWYLDAANKDTGTIATLTVSSGRLVFTHSDTNAYWDGFGTSFSCTVGEVYVVKADIHSATNMNVLRISNTASQHDEDIPVAGSNVAGVHAHTFTATATTMYLHWNGYTNTSAMQLNSVSVRLGVEDRSSYGNGLQVFGTITKSSVAYGAELVAYSGFSASNYLQQPYNSDLNFGTGNLSIIFWYKLTSTTDPQCFIHRGDGGSGTWGSGALIQIEMDSSNMEMQLAASGFSSFDQVQVPIAQSATGEWQHFVGVREGGRMHIYIDGEKYGNVASTRDLSNTAATTWIGQRPNASRPLTNGSMALLRMSPSVPTEEQVIKMYNEEKCLFHKNAKCALYGTSDDVKAIAFDDTTNILHVGTSGGRSDFRGLNRINNTTTAVTTAISASNEFVAEQ